MRHSRTWLALLALWLLTLACAAPEALSSAGVGGAEASRAESVYPGKVGRFEEHHFWPRYLGGPANGRTFKLPAPYHQLITNAFRQRWEYGRSPPDPQVAQQIMMKVYADHPIPQLIGIPDP